MPSEQDGTSVVVPTDNYIVTRPLSVAWQYKPVAARIFGGGTSSVLPAAASGAALPEGAILVSHSESTTGTGARI